MIDVIIIGGGPAGISAALYLKRQKKEVVVFTTHNSTLKKAHKIDNYYGVSNISGDELYEIGINQAIEIGVKIINSEVLEINKEKDFSITTTSGIYNSKVVIIATGVSRLGSNIKGLDSLDGRGVSYCATCDGFFFKDKEVALIGSGDYALLEAKHLLQVTPKVTIFTNGELVSEKIIESGIKTNTTKINEIKKENQLILIGDKEYQADGIFVALGVAGSGAFAKKLGLATNGNYLLVNERFETFIPGLYAIGDCIGGFLQISKAVNDGALVSLHINKYLKEELK